MYVTKLSSSRIKTWKQCIFKYALTYEMYLCEECENITFISHLIDRGISIEEKRCLKCNSENLIRPDLGRNFAAEFGTLIHDVLEKYALSFLDYEKYRQYRDWRKTYHLLFTGQISDPPPFEIAKPKDFAEIIPTCQTCEFADRHVCSLSHENLNELTGCPLKIYRDGLAMLEGAISRHFNDIENEKIIDVEREFDIEIVDGVRITGFMDLVKKVDEDTISIVDYKTGNYTQNFDQLRDDIQAQLYSIAAKRIYKDVAKNIILIFDYFKSQPIILSFTTNEDKETIKFSSEVFNTIKNQRRLMRRKEDYVCKYMCNRPLCDEIWERLTN